MAILEATFVIVQLFSFKKSGFFVCEGLTKAARV